MSAGSFTRNLHVLEKGPQARFYSPNLARFLQPDSIVPGAANPQNLNRYAYVLNSPANMTDPSGHACSGALLDNQCVMGYSETGTSNSSATVSGSGYSSSITSQEKQIFADRVNDKLKASCRNPNSGPVIDDCVNGGYEPDYRPPPFWLVDMQPEYAVFTLDLSGGETILLEDFRIEPWSEEGFNLFGDVETVDQGTAIISGGISVISSNPNYTGATPPGWIGFSLDSLSTVIDPELNWRIKAARTAVISYESWLGGLVIGSAAVLGCEHGGMVGMAAGPPVGGAGGCAIGGLVYGAVAAATFDSFADLHNDAYVFPYIDSADDWISHRLGK